MTISGTGGIFSVAPQAAKVGNGAFPNAYPWRRFRAPNINVAPQQIQDLLPPETGGPIVPNYGFKIGTFFGGDITIIPRTQRDISFLFYALMGNVTSVAVSGHSGAFRHDFTLSADGGLTLPWMACRRFVPGPSGQTLGETAWDCRVTQMRMTFGNSGITAINFGILGRRWEQTLNPNWTYSSEAESGESTPIVGNGHLRLAGTSYPIVGGEIMMSNMMTTPADEYIVGSYYPDDFIPLYRMLQVRVFYKYDNPVFYREILNNGGSTFSPIPRETITTGNDFGFDLTLLAPHQIGSSGHNFGMRITANKMIWAMGDPLMLNANQIVIQEFVGTALLPTNGDYATVSLFNGESTFNWLS